MTNSLGITHDGLKTALRIKDDYRHHRPLCVPGEDNRILIPENVMNQNLNLQGLDDPLALAMVATRDPEPPMALAAMARLSPLGRKTELISGVVAVVGEASKHPLVRECVSLITENAFRPDSIAEVRSQASNVIVHSRARYTAALRRNLRALIAGTIAPRQFVQEFFALTEAGNMRSDIRKKLVLSLLLSENIRPSIKFLLLENFHRMPEPVRHGIVSAVLDAPPSHHVDIMKDELKWIIRGMSANAH